MSPSRDLRLVSVPSVRGFCAPRPFESFKSRIAFVEHSLQEQSRCRRGESRRQSSRNSDSVARLRRCRSAAADLDEDADDARTIFQRKCEPTTRMRISAPSSRESISSTRTRVDFSSGIVVGERAEVARSR